MRILKKTPILNLSDVGGYIDGNIVHNLTVSGPVEDNSEQKETNSNSVLMMVEDNKNAIGHLVNHPSFSLGQTANIEVLSFHWNDIATSENISSNEYHDIPNARRSDGTAWYLDNGIGDLVHFHLAKILPRIRRRH